MKRKDVVNYMFFYISACKTIQKIIFIDSVKKRERKIVPYFAFVASNFVVSSGTALKRSATRP